MRHGHRQRMRGGYAVHRRAVWYALQGAFGWQVWDRIAGATLTAPSTRARAHKAARKLAAQAWQGR